MMQASCVFLAEYNNDDADGYQFWHKLLKKKTLLIPLVVVIQQQNGLLHCTSQSVSPNSNLQLLKAQILISTRNWGIYLAQRILIFPSVLGVDVYWISGIFGSILIAAHPKNSKYTSILACNLIRWLPTIHGAFTISQPQFSLSSNHECRNLGKKSTEKRMFTFGHCPNEGGTHA